MAKNPYFNPNPAEWWHGDEMFEGKEATLEEAWHTWETGYPDSDGWDRSDWREDILHSDFMGDMLDEAFEELMILIASNRRDAKYAKLIKYVEDHINTAIEG
jgi:hypothetical protein